MITQFYDGCNPLTNTDIICPDMSLFKACSTPLINTVNTVLKMIADEKADSYYSLNKSNINPQEEVFFDIVFNKNIKDNLDIAIMKDNMRFIYLPDEEIDNILFKFSTYSTVNENDTNNFGTFTIGNLSRSDEEASIKLCIDIITYKINLELKKLGVPFSRITKFGNDVIALPEVTSLSDVKFAVDYYICLFKTLDTCIDLRYSDFDKVKNALFAGYDLDIFDMDFESLQAIYNYAIETDSTSEEYKDLIKKVFNDI